MRRCYKLRHRRYSGFRSRARRESDRAGRHGEPSSLHEITRTAIPAVARSRRGQPRVLSAVRLTRQSPSVYRDWCSGGTASCCIFADAVAEVVSDEENAFGPGGSRCGDPRLVEFGPVIMPGTRRAVVALASSHRAERGTRSRLTAVRLIFCRVSCRRSCAGGPG
jgi:hypothetical protein